MEERNSPYVFRDEARSARDPDPPATDDDVVINEGRAMTYREYCESEKLE